MFSDESRFCLMGGSECGNVEVNVVRIVASPNVTVLAAVASWSGSVFAAVIAPG